MSDMNDERDSFLSRWSRRKAAVRGGEAVPPEAPAAPAAPAADLPATIHARPEVAAPEVPLPTLADVAALKPGDDIARFVVRGVDESVKRAALKTLFADPHFNVMDGLDVYIDDYGKPDPIPPDILRRLTQSETLGLFDPVAEEAAPGPQTVPAAAPGPETVPVVTAPVAEGPDVAARPLPADPELNPAPACEAPHPDASPSSGNNA